MGLALFGGGFDPPHRTHRRILEAALELPGVDLAIVLPCGEHAIKGAGAMPAGEIRLELCELAFADLDRVEVSDFEVRRRGPSYTLDTVRHFGSHPACGGRRPVWLIGSDNVASLPSWHRYHELFEVAELVVFPRLGHPVEAALAATPGLTAAERRALASRVLDVEPDDVSSTAIRAALRAGRDVGALVEPAVLRRVRELDLYG